MTPTPRLILLLLATAATPAAATPAAAPAAPPEPALAPLYALAAIKLLGEQSKDEFYLLPSSAAPELTVRRRWGSGEPRSADWATTTRVARALRHEGLHGERGLRAHAKRDGALQLILGQLRFEPPEGARFARLAIGIVGSDPGMTVLDFLLRREGGTWLVINMRVREKPTPARAPA